MDIVVLCGGLSPERNVSLSSGRKITAALKSLGHRAVLVDMYLGLEGFSGPLETAFDLPLPEGGDGIAEQEPVLDEVRRERRLRSRSLFGERVLEICAAADLVFLALHGKCGEDGRVQAAFDLLGIKYTGSGFLGSAAAMDKHLTKLVARSVGVRTPEWRLLGGSQLQNTAEIAGATPLPCVVKPVDSGSSIGVEIARSADELSGALRRAAESGSQALLEQYIEGRDIQISILGGRPLPSIEILPIGGFYDYRRKYQPGCAEEISPARIPGEAESELAAAALAVYNALGLKSLARADFVLDAAGRFWFLEINTLPGMTPTSLAPQEAAAAGMNYEQLCQRIIELALEEDRI